MKFPGTVAPTRDLLVLLGLGLLVVGIGIGFRLPFPPDEPRFVLIAREMLATGNWLIPLRGGELYSDKPPLQMWLIALGYMATGSWRWSFQIPSLVAALATLAMIYDLARRLFDRESALLAGTMLLFSVQFLVQAKSGQLDMLLTAFMMAGVYGILRHLLCGPAWTSYFLGSIAMGLGVLTKIIGFFPFFLALPALWLAWRGNPQVRLHNFWLLCLGPLLMLATALTWILPMHLHVAASGDPALLAYERDFLLGQTIGRYADPDGHFKPAWYYFLNVIPLFWLPLSLLLIWLVPRWIRAWRSGDARIILPLSYVLFVVLFFSLSGGKRNLYIFSALPMVALAAAPWLREILGRTRAPVALWWLSGALALALTAVWPLLPLYRDQLDPAAEYYRMAPWTLLSTMGVVSLLVVLVTPRRLGHRAWIGLMIVSWTLYSTWGAAIMNPVISPIATMQQIYQRIGPEGELGMFDFREQYLLYSERLMAHFGYHTEPEVEARVAAAWLQASASRYLLIDAEYIPLCFTAGSGHHLGALHNQDFWLIDRSAVAPNCEPDAGGPVFRSVTTYQPPL